MRFIGYTNWSQLPVCADKLFNKGARENMFFSRAWLENLTETIFDNNQSLLLACVIDDDTMLVILPLIQQSDGNWQSLSHSYSSLFTVLVEENSNTNALKCLAKGLSESSFNTLQLKPFDEHDPNILQLQYAMEEIGISCHSGHRFYNWTYLVQNQTFEQYMASRPSKVRSTIARKQRKLEREQRSEVRLYIDENIQQAIDDYNTVYKASWKAIEQQTKLLDGLIKSFANNGWLRLAVLYINNKPAAAQLWFVVYRKASIFRLAYDQAWKQYSPGSILTKYLIEHVIDTDKVDEIDFLTGNESYKQDWMSQRKARWEMVCGNKRQAKANSFQFFNRLRKLLKNFT